MTQNDDPKKSSQDDTVSDVVVHYGDIVVTVGQRFDRLDKQLLLVFKAIIALGIGELLLLGIHIPEVGPILTEIAKQMH